VLSPSAITLRWVSRLRWGAAVGQALTVLATATLLHLPVPTGWLALVIGATMLTNVALVAWLRRPREVSPRLLAAVLAFDTLSLYALLYLTGGPSNPFSVLFLVQIALAALVLGLGYALGITVLSTAAYAALFASNVPLAGMEHMHHAGTSAFSVHLQGMFVAFLLAAVLIAYFVTRVALELRTRERALASAERRAQTNEKLASLSTLAAGAAHELGTPLATIAVVATELERAAARLPDGPAAQSLRDDARLVRTEVERCSAIVRQMSRDAGGTPGEAPEPLGGHEVTARLLRGVEPEQAGRLDVEAVDVQLHLPPRALVQVLGSLVKNAFDASDSTGRVRVSLESRVQDGAPRARFVVGDRGLGMSDVDLARIGEPFFTTKPPGAGLGLGVFLARAFADRLGGHLTFSSQPGEGTTVVLDLPTTCS
jgi:two-component system sensor histidine kinase RegB